MPFKTTIAAVLLGTLALAQAQSTITTYIISPSQSSKVSVDLASYASALAGDAHLNSIAAELSTVNIPAATLASILDNAGTGGLLFGVPTTTVDFISYATAPPVSLTTTPPWVTGLPGNVRSDVLALQTSVIRAQASIIRSDWSINAAQPTGAVGLMKAAGVAIGAVGVAAALL